MHKFRPAMKWVLGLLFVAAGVNHFVKPEIYAKIMPPYLPWHAELVLVSGVCEVLGGIGLLVPRLTRVAAWGLVALLVAVFPANVHMALHPEIGAELFPVAPEFVWWVRLPVQLLFIAWAGWYARPEPALAEPPAGR
ncbi:MAG: DoxX family protein [Gemmataceae bacterium]|nr:DoxX family protein [Gemmataceae bacterium]